MDWELLDEELPVEETKDRRVPTISKDKYPELTPTERAKSVIDYQFPGPLDVLKESWNWVLGKEVKPTTDVIMGVVDFAPFGVTLGKYKFLNKAMETAFDESRILPKQKLLGVIKDKYQGFKRVFRDFPSLPHTGEYAELRDSILTLRKQKVVAADKAKSYIKSVLEELNPNEYSIFNRKVVLEDLAETGREGLTLPKGFTLEAIGEELPRLEKEISKSPKIAEALVQRRLMWKDVVDNYTLAMENIGVDVSERMSKAEYFRHQVIDYATNASPWGTGQKLKTPVYRGFLKKRHGSELAINTDYLQPEFEALSQMLEDTKIANTIFRIKSNPIYNIEPMLKKDAKVLGQNIQDIIPDGYIQWYPRKGHALFLSHSIPEKYANMLLSGELDQMGIKVDDLVKRLSVGKGFTPLIVKEEVAQALDNITKPEASNVVLRIMGKAQTLWKIWTLTSPRRAIKYNIRNAFGDLDITIAGNPSALKKVPQATMELYRSLAKGQPMTEELQAWFEKGGMASTLQAQELGTLYDLKQFEKFAESKHLEKLSGLPSTAWRKYWEGVRLSTDFREGILRYSNHLDYLEKLNANKGIPPNFGASIPEEIMGLSNNRDKAFWLANDLMGAYDRVSVFGQGLREYIYPFWSWKETNFVRYIRLAKNTAYNPENAISTGRAILGESALALKLSPLLLRRIGAFAIKATTLWSMTQAWNHLKFPELEKQLPPDERARPHLIFGRDVNGKIISFTRLGSLGDFLTVFGLDAAPQHVDKWLSGRATIKDIALEMAKSPINEGIQGVSPFYKTPFELITRRALFPKVFRPGTIRDRGYHLARTMALEHEYKLVMDLPTEKYGYLKSFGELAVYKTEAEATAYQTIFDLKNNYLKKTGRGAEGFWLTPSGNALYYFKQALRYQDKDAAERYLVEYINHSIGPRDISALTDEDRKRIRIGLTSSLQRMQPLSGLSKAEQIGFIASLDEEEKDTLKLANEYYTKTLLGGHREEAELESDGWTLEEEKKKSLVDIFKETFKVGEEDEK